MSRKEHKKYVKDMLAQAIVHKTLDLERTRQAEIKKKLEEIAKIQLVQRVRVGMILYFRIASCLFLYLVLTAMVSAPKNATNRHNNNNIKLILDVNK